MAGSKAGNVILARILVNGQAGRADYARAIALLQQASMNTESDVAVDAQMLLGLIYANGEGVREDDVKATDAFKKKLGTVTHRLRRILGRDDF